MTNFSPYLFFDGTCFDAMEFYKSVFGGELTVTYLRDLPSASSLDASLAERVAMARLLSRTVDLSASDWLNPTQRPVPGNTVCIYLSDATYEELQEWFAGLSEGADQSTLDALNVTEFGTFGALTDQYGVRWMFQGLRPAQASPSPLAPTVAATPPLPDVSPAPPAAVAPAHLPRVVAKPQAAPSAVVAKNPLAARPTSVRSPGSGFHGV